MPYIIELRDVGYCVNGDRPRVSGVSTQIRQGELLVLLGRSGSGKARRRSS